MIILQIKFLFITDGSNENKSITTSRRIKWGSLNANNTVTYDLVSTYYLHLLVFIFAEGSNGTAKGTALLNHYSNTYTVGDITFTLNTRINGNNFDNKLTITSNSQDSYSSYCIIQN